MKRKDLLLLLAILIIAVVSFVGIKTSQKGEGKVAIIEIENKPYKKVSLIKDDTFHIDLPKNNGVDIVIKDGTLQVENSTCLDHVCESMGPIEKTGEIIVCLPNQVIIYIED